MIFVEKVKDDLYCNACCVRYLLEYREQIPLPVFMMPDAYQNGMCVFLKHLLCSITWYLILNPTSEDEHLGAEGHLLGTTEVEVEGHLWGDH